MGTTSQSSPPTPVTIARPPGGSTSKLIRTPTFWWAGSNSPSRRADPSEEATLWSEFARLGPGFDEYRNLTERRIPVVVLEVRRDVGDARSRAPPVQTGHSAST
jgi:hypothetical protein